MMDYKLHLKQLISDAINSGNISLDDASEMLSFIIDSYIDDSDAFDAIQELFPEISETIESSEKIYSSTADFHNVDSILSDVTNLFEGYIQEPKYLSASRQYDVKIDRMFGNGLSIRVGVRDTSNEPRGSISPSSNADRYPCVFTILDNSENAPLLDAFYDAGFYEVCNYRNSQWGTYKIVINNHKDLVAAKDIFEKFVCNELPYTGQ